MTYRQRRGLVYVALGCVCVLIGIVVPAEPYGLLLTLVGFGFVVVA
jgi:hypothetical protein